MGKKARRVLADLNLEAIDRFWRKVKKLGENECWPWMGCKSNGYGSLCIYYLETKTKRYVLAHRVAWVLANGDLSPGLVVRHRCHNKWCCNPAHLLAGTIQENNLDMRRARRSLHGSRNPRSKLSEDQAREILGLKGCGIKAGELAERYGVSVTAIRFIWNGTSWIHLDPLEKLIPDNPRASATQ